MAELPRWRGRTPSKEAHWGPVRAYSPTGAVPLGGEDAFAQQLVAPRSCAPSRSVRALSPIARRGPFEGGSEGGP
eukprot:13882853-Alexandrium_andersonii.AAC.1